MEMDNSKLKEEKICKHLLENINKEPKICEFFRITTNYELCKKCELKDKI
jgi:hypothetical protein